MATSTTGQGPVQLPLDIPLSLSVDKEMDAQLRVAAHITQRKVAGFIRYAIAKELRNLGIIDDQGRSIEGVSDGGATD